MAWTDTAVTILRNLIGDTTSPSTYDDDRLIELLYSSAFLVIHEIPFGTTYTINLTGLSISPDPITMDDKAFVSLVVLKAACTIFNVEYHNASSKAMIIRDGPSTIDAKYVAESKKSLAESMCKNYYDSKIAFIAGDSSLCCAIIGPHNFGTSYYPEDDISLMFN